MLNPGLGFSSQLVLTSVLEGIWNGRWCIIQQVANSLGLLALLLRVLSKVLVLEGFSKDLSELDSCGGRITAEDEGRLSQQEVTEELILSLALFDIVSDWQETDPVCDQLSCHGLILHDKGVLVANDLTKTCDGIVLGMVVLGHLVFLGLDLLGDWHVDSFLERFKAELTI